MRGRVGSGGGRREEEGGGRGEKNGCLGCGVCVRESRMVMEEDSIFVSWKEEEPDFQGFFWQTRLDEQNEAWKSSL